MRNALRTVDFGCETIVRINSLDSEFCEEDLKEIVPCAPGAIMPPKSSRREDMLSGTAVRVTYTRGPVDDDEDEEALLDALASMED